MLIPFIFEVITLLFNITPILAQSTCGPKVSARLLMDIPCDMSKSNFCELSGTIYPWAAVRRYIYENQGLLKRMYGDQRHYQILTNEIQDLREKYDNVFINNKETKFYESNHIFHHQTPFNKYQPQFRPRSFFVEEGEDDDEEGVVLGGQNKKVESKGDGDNNVVKSVNETQTSSIDNRTVNSENSVQSDVKTVNNGSTYNQAFILKENSENDDNQESTTIQTPSDILTSTNVQNSPSDSEYLEAAMTTTPDYNSPATESLDPGMTIAERFYMVGGNEQKAPETSSSTTISMSNEHKTSSTSTSSAAPNPLTDNGSSEESDNNQPSQPSIPTDPVEQPKSKGVNACPVREEVIAPYWANNTRGEILALLNVYPFEQYVHWEKCAHENSQMFCRDGCRCEQQYRLHRLLAFDPKNECRGIFADWFRFPSCCVCICYDLPESNIFYRTTKRKSRL